MIGFILGFIIGIAFAAFLVKSKVTVVKVPEEELTPRRQRAVEILRRTVIIAHGRRDGMVMMSQSLTRALIRDIEGS